MRSRAWRAGMALILAGLILVVATVAVAVTRGRNTAGPSGSSGSVANPGAAARVLAAKARQQAAVWATENVSVNAIMACDPAMCAALQARGIAASRLLVLRAGQADPLGSDVLMATVAVRNQFGGRLAGVYAPVVLAAFGSGTARIDIRVVAPDGTSDYLKAMSADLKARVTVGSQLAHNPRVHTPAAARAQLAAGLVDSRLLASLATVASQHAVDVLGFGDVPGPAATAGVPLRAALIAWTPPPAGVPGPTLRTLLNFFRSQRPPYRPSSVKEVTTTSQRTVLRVEYSAPSPLGLLGSRG
ncbi:MAG TPA: hypothetical protein VIV12_18745 [Streptosporangiaceae bacterium]